MNKEQIEILFKRKHKQLIYFAYKMILNWNEAEDIVSDSFLRVAMIPDEEITNEDGAGGLLHTTVKNKRIDLIRHRNHKTLVHSELLNSSSSYVEALEIKSDLVELIIMEIEKLPASRKKVIKLFMEGYTVKEISQLLNISPDTTRVNIFKARETLMPIYKNLN